MSELKEKELSLRRHKKVRKVDRIKAEAKLY
jgi:hypothetical protein